MIFFEVDCSIGHDDADLHGGNTMYFNSTRWAVQKNIVDVSFGGMWTVDAVAKLRTWQYNECVHHNPGCSRGAFGSIGFDIGQNLVNSIMPPADPFGVTLPPKYEYISTFFGVSEVSPGNFVMDVGGEKLPGRSAADNYYYRRADPLTLNQVATTGAYTFLHGEPTPHLPGFNQGAVDTYFPDLSNFPPDYEDVTADDFICYLSDFVRGEVSCVIEFLPILIPGLGDWVSNALNSILTITC